MSHIERNASAHQADIDATSDAEYLQTEAEDKAFSELQASFLLAIEKKQAITPVPNPVRDYGLVGIIKVADLPWILKKQPVINAVFDILCNSDRFDEILINAICESEKFKLRMAEEFAEMYCEGLAQVDLQPGVHK